MTAKLVVLPYQIAWFWFEPFHNVPKRITTQILKLSRPVPGTEVGTRVLGAGHRRGAGSAWPAVAASGVPPTVMALTEYPHGY